MKVTRKENYTLIKNDSDSLTEFTSELTKNHDKFKENLVIDLSKYNDLDQRSFLGFLEISNLHKEEHKSFVIVNNSVGIDELPEELIVVPTLQEAEDMIQMDEIQRDLGF